MEREASTKRHRRSLCVARSEGCKMSGLSQLYIAKTDTVGGAAISYFRFNARLLSRGSRDTRCDAAIGHLGIDFSFQDFLITLDSGIKNFCDAGLALMFLNRTRRAFADYLIFSAYLRRSISSGERIQGMDNSWNGR